MPQLGEDFASLDPNFRIENQINSYLAGNTCNGEGRVDEVDVTRASQSVESEGSVAEGQDHVGVVDTQSNSVESSNTFSASSVPSPSGGAIYGKRVSKLVSLKFIKIESCDQNPKILVLPAIERTTQDGIAVREGTSGPVGTGSGVGKEGERVESTTERQSVPNGASDPSKVVQATGNTVDVSGGCNLPSSFNLEVG